MKHIQRNKKYVQNLQKRISVNLIRLRM